MSDLRLIIITPGRNEASRLQRLAASLQKVKINFQCIWIYVDDSSSDETLSILDQLIGIRPDYVLRAQTSGRISKGGAYKCWNVGVKFALENGLNFSHLMKLDADVELDPDYFSALENDMRNSLFGILGGVLMNSSREQSIHVPGPVKLYSRECLAGISSLPLETGYDVMDEVFARSLGYEILVNPKSQFRLNRDIGLSQGSFHGRRRNGIVCRWTGYSKIYFALHAFRYLFRKPYLLGSFAMIFGFSFAPESPYPENLRRLHSRAQRKLLLKILRNPIRALFVLYKRPKVNLIAH